MNMTILRKIRYSWKMLTTVFTCFFGISLFFICSSIPQNFFAHFLHVDPSYTGGLVCADFINSSDDGSPLLRYTVHEPVTNARWQQSAEYWQLDLEFKNDAGDFQNIIIFIDADNMGDFNADEEAAGDFELRIKDDQGKLYDGSDNFICNSEYYKLDGGRLIKIRIPLKDKRVQNLLAAKKTRHYICQDSLPPLVIEASMKSHKKTKSEEQKDKAYINYVKGLYAENQSAQSVQNKTTDENLAFYKEKINNNPEDFVSLACYGSWLAVKGGESSVMKAVALVNEAYTYLDKAAQMAIGQEGEIDVLMNRASVSASVPEQVFGKAAAGAEDFIRIVSLTENEILKAYCYVMAYECYQKCGKETQSILALQEAQKMVQYQ
jgi:hypothetical protein